MIPREKVEAIVSKHNTIEKELSSGSVDPKIFAEKSKEYAELGNILKNAVNYLNFKNEKKDLENIIKDGRYQTTMKSNRQMLLEKMSKNMPLLPNEVGNGSQHGGMLPVGVRQINPKPPNQEYGEDVASDS